MNAPLDKLIVGGYVLPVEVQQSAASVAGTTVWAMRAGAVRACAIRNMALSVIYSGIAVPGATVRYVLQRFDTASPTGGTLLVPQKKNTLDPATDIATARVLDTGLTTAGIVFGPDAKIYGCAISLTSMSTSRVEPSSSPIPFTLMPGEGLAIRLQTVASINVGIFGFIEWDEFNPT